MSIGLGFGTLGKSKKTTSIQREVADSYLEGMS
jgi:hypothetical protein